MAEGNVALVRLISFFLPWGITITVLKCRREWERKFIKETGKSASEREVSLMNALLCLKIRLIGAREAACDPWGCVWSVRSAEAWVGVGRGRTCSCCSGAFSLMPDSKWVTADDAATSHHSTSPAKGKSSRGHSADLHTKPACGGRKEDCLTKIKLSALEIALKLVIYSVFFLNLVRVSVLQQDGKEFNLRLPG